MNKQEATEEIKNLEGVTILDKTINFDSEMISKKEVFNIINQIDEPEKPTVPQYVADWYESINYDFEHEVYDLCVKIHYSSERLSREIQEWFNESENKPIQTLVAMRQFGYEVEKEKLYTVSLKKNGIGIGVQQQDGSFKERFTKTELSEYGFDNLDEYEIEEVEG